MKVSSRAATAGPPRPRSPPAEQPSYRGKLAYLTVAVVASQITFIGVAYAHALLHQQVTADTFHISSVLDDDVRSVLCAAVGVFGFCAMVALELTRVMPRPILRTALAAASGSGIVLTCAVRESAYLNGHRLSAVLAFGAAFALVWVVVSLAPTIYSRCATAVFTLLVIVTAIAQGTHVISFDLYDVSLLPSWALGTLELGLLLSFAACICTCISAGAAHAAHRAC